ncbi:hypothetical protein CLV81_3444 [Flagellimonas meridianipacifica]|uniref:Uncharacterized protein n=2 Tax=Flagellimonas meridianipacifica TaxID=1080225 RepID=A0A2T0MC15_9FLAO|nr:hypothetical protein CLV81_3444 [Allomuricauda pacifica]
MLPLLLLFLLNAFSQETAIIFSNHGKTEELALQNPLKAFIGEWTLKDDSWTQNWGGETETITIPMHHTISTQINTANSLFSIIDGPEPNGHIFWSYNPVTKVVNHLSSFGALRAGVGAGSITKSGDVTLKISFEGEPKETYRIYHYKWISQDEYHMKSTQYNSDDAPTGLFYEGTFVRLPDEKERLKSQIEAILAVLDNNALTVERQLEVYTDDVVHMAPESEANIGKEALSKFLKEQRKYGESIMKHEILEMEVYGSVIVMRGRVTGRYHPKNNTSPMPFVTKNLFVFRQVDRDLKIGKVIYNMSPPNNE